MENATSPFDGIFSLMLLLGRSNQCNQRPHTSYSSSHSRSGSVTPPPTELNVCRPGHPADSFQRPAQRPALRRRSKWSWTGRSAPEFALGSPAESVAEKKERKRASRMMTWATPNSEEKESYMSERAHARHTNAMDRKLPRIHEMEACLEDDEEQHNEQVRQQGISDDDEISAVKRTRALDALEQKLPLRRNSEVYDAVLMQAEMGPGVHRGGWGEAWSPL
ncbi:hypothetical protein FH972_022193 [Carpinus fangiana]|uniref:Uncharacterized protein n=1 Tax=Carpinus fangiana TaxID=176857 RepID=A0A5N6KRW2_9ROSI|nr:hypothetical protein FH972_022193 [Carpinus fangiana]